MRKVTTEEFIEKAKEVHGDKYDYSLVNYLDQFTKVKIVCPVHGIFEQAPKYHLGKKYGCPKCAHEAKRLTTEEFIEKAKEVHGDKYDYSKTEFVTYRDGKIKIICPKHGVFEQTPPSHIRGNGCPKCCSSHGESQIRNYLKDNGVFFEEQKRFKDLGRLSFDFFVPSKNLLIEYNGRQHYEESCFKHHDLQKQRENDKKKKEYAIKKDLELLVIPYWESSCIAKILEKKIIL